MSRQQRRDQLARAEGFASYTDKRNAQARALGYRNYADQRRSRSEGRPRAADTRAQAPRIVRTPGGTTAQSTKRGRGLGAIESRINKAGDRQVFATVVVRAPGGPRSVNLFGKGGWSAAKLAGAIADAGGLGAFIVAMIAELYQGEPWAENLTEADLEHVSVTISR